MNAQQQIDLQQAVIDYFVDVNDITVALVVNSFVYSRPTKVDVVSRLIEAFLKDNGLIQTFLNHIADQREDMIIFKSSYSEREMMNNLNVAFLNLAFNRFMHSINTKPVQPVKVVKEIKLSEPEKAKFVCDNETFPHVHMVNPINSDYTICGILIDGEYTSGVDRNTSDGVSCSQCKGIVKSCKKAKV